MADLLRDVLSDGYDVSAPPHPSTISAIDAGAPDVVIVGLEDGGLPQPELIAQAAGHVRLHRVPFVLMSADRDLLGHAARLSMFAHVSLVSLPFDADTIRSAVDGAVRAAGTAASRSSNGTSW